jgi:glucodextranase-like protein
VIFEKIKNLTPVFLVVWAALSGVYGCAVTKGIVVEDPQGDDYGPGGYRYPDHPVFGQGAFDLREVSLSRQGDDWVVEVVFSSRIKQTQVFVTQDDRRQVFIQTADIYFRTAGEGYSQSLPGRGVTFAEGHAWHKAVVLSAVPDLLRQALAKTTQLSSDVYVPLKVKVSGRKLRARVPVEFLGEQKPQALVVLISGTKFSISFKLVDRIRSKLAPEGLVMDVSQSSRECRLDDPQGVNCSFSGCNPCGSHPKVIDLLAPVGVQEEILRAYQPDTGKTAQVPMIEIGPLK